MYTPGYQGSGSGPRKSNYGGKSGSGFGRKPAYPRGPRPTGAGSTHGRPPAAASSRPASSHASSSTPRPYNAVRSSSAPSYGASRPYQGGRPSSFRSGSKPGGFRGGSSGGGSRGGGGRRFGGMRKRMKVDLSKLVNKVSITEETLHYTPEHKFSDFKIDERLKLNISQKGYTTPTPIQDKIIPRILEGLDVVGIANTGTGKTAAFLIPLINKILLNPKEKAIIMAPTRELAIQIDEELRGFTKKLGMFSVCCVGGANIRPQMQALRNKNSFIIGTPGRLKDLLERKCLNLAEIGNVVLDEADRMLDMGFIGDMKYMLALMPKDKQGLFFSATLSPEIENLIKQFLKDPLTVSVKTQDTSKNIHQDVVRVDLGKSKFEILCSLLRDPDFKKVLIFGETKHGVEKLYKDLVKEGFKAESIHGNKNHAKRQKTLAMFKGSQMQVLVATDVAARGLDIDNVTHVINYDLPPTYEDYIHRIGRTGRGDKKGKALTFID